MIPRDTLVWLDLETTGLDPRSDAILEIAIRLSDSSGLSLDAFSQVVEFDGRNLSNFILDMHTKNGLLAEASPPSLSTTEVENYAIAWLGRPAPHSLTLAGSSVHFDLGFLAVHMPRLAAMFSHRLFDVSAIKLFCQRLGMSPLPKAEAHRAMADVEESYSHFIACVNFVCEYNIGHLAE